MYDDVTQVDFDSILANDGPHLMPASEDAVAGSVALFHWYSLSLSLSLSVCVCV
jgi:hypothetical protein